MKIALRHCQFISSLSRYIVYLLYHLEDSFLDAAWLRIMADTLRCSSRVFGQQDAIFDSEIRLQTCNLVQIGFIQKLAGILNTDTDKSMRDDVSNLRTNQVREIRAELIDKNAMLINQRPQRCKLGEVTRVRQILETDESLEDDTLTEESAVHTGYGH